MQFQRCKKNEGHDTFIPALQLSLENLPEHVRSKSVLDFIKVYVARTVQLKICYTSTGRPHDYIFYKFRGKHFPIHHGTGLLYNVEKRVGWCPCERCLKKSDVAAPGVIWWAVDLVTACHVLYDSEEAKATEVNFFFDELNSFEQGKVKTIQGAQVLNRSPESDWCKFRCAIHDRDLAVQLKGLLQPSHELWLVKPSSSVQDKLCVIISHPHAMHKMVTLGKIKKMNLYGKDHRFSYSTDTCSGSSGGPVIVLQDNIGPGLEWSTWAHWISVHSGSPKHLQQNESSDTIELRT